MKPAVDKREHNSERYANNIRYPILHISTAPKGRLEDLYEAAKCACANEDWDQPKAPRARQRKGERCEGNEVYKFVGAIRRWGWLMDRPKHGYCQYSSYNQCERDIEILAHVNRLYAGFRTQGKAKICEIRGKRESDAYSGAWGFR